MKNRQLLYIGNDKFKIITQDLNQKCNENEVMIKLLYCGICGSDLGYTYVSNHSENNPIVLGHEMVGKIIDIGKNVTDFSIGDYVIANPGDSCGECEYCKSGRVNMCPNTKFTGFPPYDGFFQEYIKYPKKHLYKINVENPLLATLVEPLAVCLHSLELADFKFGMTAYIAGAGGIGASLLYLLKRYGASKVIVSEPNEHRRQIAKKLGADLIINPTNKSSDEILNEMKSNGFTEVDRYFEASGSNSSLTYSTHLTKIGGQIIAIGIPKNDIFNISHSEARKKALTIKMERTIKNNIPTAIEILEHDDTLNILISKCISFEEMVNNFSLVRNNEIESSRVIVKI